MVTLVVSGLQRNLGRKKQVVREQVPSKVIQVGDSLAGGKVFQWRGLSSDACKHLLCVSKLATLEISVSGRSPNKCIEDRRT